MKAALLLTALLATACAPAGDETPDPDMADDPGMAPAAPADPADPSMSQTEPGSVGVAGIGPYRIGSTAEELMPHLDGEPDVEAGMNCGYGTPSEGPEGLLLMFVDDQLVRVDITEGDTPTREGARVGDTEARVLELYPDARREPHKYTDGSYLVVMPGAPTDTVARYVFETDGAVVTRYRAGRAPEVGWVEGCF